MSDRPASQSARVGALVAEALHRAVDCRPAPATLGLAVQALLAAALAEATASDGVGRPEAEDQARA